LVDKILRTSDIDLALTHLSTTPEKCHFLWNAVLFPWSQLCDFMPKLDNFDKQLAITLSWNLNFRQPKIRSYYLLCWHPFSVFSDIDHSLLAFSPCLDSRQRADSACKDVMLFHCICSICIYQEFAGRPYCFFSIATICQQNKSNFWLWELVQL